MVGHSDCAFSLHEDQDSGAGLDLVATVLPMPADVSPQGEYGGYIGIMEKKMETTTLY